MRWSKANFQKIDRVVARRVITAVDEPKKRIRLSLGTPRRVARNEWQCPILIDGLEKAPIADLAPGADSLQALILGVRCIRWHLKRSGRRFAWLGDSELAGIGGIPYEVPTGFGKEFDLRIERAIEREVRNARKFRAPILRRWFAEGQGTPGARKAPKENRRPKSVSAARARKSDP